MRYQRLLTQAEASLYSARRALECTRSPIEKINLKSRIPLLEQELHQARLRADNLAEVDVLFDGEPVRSSLGIDAAFAGDSLRSFQDYVSTLTAANQGELGARGPLPRVPRLMVADVEVGSFGFQLVELPEQESITSTPLKGALDDALRLLQAAGDSDEAFVEALARRGQRVQMALKKFLDIVSQANATIKMHSRQISVIFDTSNSVHAALDRVDQTTVKEQEEEVFDAILYGWLQGKMRFELLLDNGEILSGPIERSALAHNNIFQLNQRVRAKIRKVTLEQAGRTRQTRVLLAMETQPASP